MRAVPMFPSVKIPQMASSMHLHSKRLAQALLEHHRNCCWQVKREPEELTDDEVDGCCLTYLQIALKCGGPMPRFSGTYLDQITVWCHNQGWPSLASLVVDGTTRRPGEGYNDPPNVGLENWPTEVRQCITCRRYPAKLPPVL